MSDLQKSVVVTGVSSGIGRAIAVGLMKDGWHVFGSVRKAPDAEPLEAFGDAFTPLIFDVTDDAGVAAASEQVSAALNGATLKGLVNNAGVAIGGPLRYLPMEELKKQFEINLFGALRVTQAFLPMLGADKSFSGGPGKIINMSSVAGKIASPIMGPYSMSKHALEAFSDSLRRELLMHGIDVVTVAPGTIKTPIWDKADDINVDQYKDTEYFDTLIGMREKYKDLGAEGLPPEAVSDVVCNIMSRPKPKTRYAILRNKFIMWTLPRLLPKRAVDKVLSERFGFPEKAPS
ncbi:MAG: SDR family oxidoreductase [Pseudomonadota bacterium]